MKMHSVKSGTDHFSTRYQKSWYDG